MRPKLIFATWFLSILFVQPVIAQKTVPIPSFQTGETFFYLVHFKSTRDIKTKSSFVLPEQPLDAIVDVNGILQVEVLSVESSGVRLRTWFLGLESNVEAHPRSGKAETVYSQFERTPSSGKFVNCRLQPDAQITQIEGLDGLAPEQQIAWREWASRFAAVFLLETQSRKRGEKWSTEEEENSPSPIAQLRWQQKSQYSKDEPCAPQKFVRSGSFERSSAQEPCAVILATAALQQKSSAQDSTPQDYKVKGLKTRGTAKGDNDTVFYISRKTGLLVRAVQNAKQEMDVAIALADGSRGVHYLIEAKANSTVELVTDLPLILQPKSSE